MRVIIRPAAGLSAGPLPGREAAARAQRASEERVRGQHGHGRARRAAVPRHHRAVGVAPEQHLAVRAVRQAGTNAIATYTS